MSIVSQSVCNSYSYEDFNQEKQDPIKALPDELVLEIFSPFNLATLGTFRLVSKGWKQLAGNSTLLKITIYL